MHRIVLGSASLLVALLVALLLWGLCDSSSTKAAWEGGPSGTGTGASIALGIEDARTPRDEEAPPDAPRLAVAIASVDATQPAPAVRQRPRVVGRVVDRDARPIADARVRAAPQGGSRSLALEFGVEAPDSEASPFEARTDSDGRFAIAGLPSGAMRVLVRAGGFAPARSPLLSVPRGYELFRLTDLVLVRGARVSGLVVDESGAPVADAEVLLALDDLESRGVAVTGRGVPLTRSADDGRFEVDELAPGPFRLMVDRPGFRVARIDGRTDAPESQRTGLTVVLSRGVEVQGSVTCPDGSLPAPILVRAQRADAERPDVERADGENAGDERAWRGSSSDAAPLDATAQRAREGECDVEGRFVIAGLADGTSYRLTAWTRTETGGAWKRLEGADVPVVRAGDAHAELRYTRPSSLAFRAVDARTRAPIETFTVWTTSSRETVLRDEKNEPWREHPGGRVSCSNLRAEAGKALEIRVRAAGYEDRVVRDVALSPGRERDLGDVALEPELRVLVHVVEDRSGEAVEGARVWLSKDADHDLQSFLRTAPERDSWSETTVQYGRTGAHGEVAFTSAPGRTVVVAASASGFAPHDTERIDLPLSTDHSLTVRLVLGATVRVRVSDGETSLPDVPVFARWPPSRWDRPGRSEMRWGRTDAEGTATFTSLAAGNYAFRVQDGDDGAPRDEGWLEVSVGAGEEREIGLAASARGRVRGRVTAAGRAVESAHVRIARADDAVDGRGDDGEWDSTDGASTAITDPDGRFEIDGVARGPHVVFVSHSRRSMVARFEIEVRGAGDDVELALDAARVEGRIVDPEGRALAGVAVSAQHAVRERDPGRPYATLLVEDGRGSLRSRYVPVGLARVRTDSRGRYELNGVASEEALVITVGGGEHERLRSDELSLARDEVRTGVDFVLRPAGRIEVALVGAGVQRDAALPRAPWYEVRAELAEGGEKAEPTSTRLNAANRSSILRSLAPGRYRVTCKLRSRERSFERAEEIEVTPGATARVTFEIP